MISITLINIYKPLKFLFLRVIFPIMCIKITGICQVDSYSQSNTTNKSLYNVLEANCTFFTPSPLHVHCVFYYIKSAQSNTIHSLLIPRIEAFQSGIWINICGKLQNKNINREFNVSIYMYNVLFEFLNLLMQIF